MKKTKSLSAYIAIKNLILKEEIKSGQMNSISSLAETISMGRAPVVDAVKRLQSEGMLDIRPRQGILVREMTVQEMRDINEVRRILEPYVIERIVPILNQEDIREMRMYLNDMKNAADEKDHYKFIELDHAMHVYLYELCGNDCIVDILKNLRDRMFIVGYKIIARRKGRMSSTIQEHESIVVALEERNVLRAAEEMRVHLTNGARLI